MSDLLTCLEIALEQAQLASRANPGPDPISSLIEQAIKEERYRLNRVDPENPNNNPELRRML